MIESNFNLNGVTIPLDNDSNELVRRIGDSTRWYPQTYRQTDTSQHRGGRLWIGQTKDVSRVGGWWEDFARPPWKPPGLREFLSGSIRLILTFYWRWCELMVYFLYVMMMVEFVYNFLENYFFVLSGWDMKNFLGFRCYRNNLVP